jgi:tetratricopeptide (TPR) repeat protein
MAKKHYPKQRSSPPQLASDDLGALEARAREDLAAGKFRKARETYKLLCKRDRERYLPGLIEANTRLMDELRERGLVSEAEQVMAYLKTIAPPKALAGLEIRAALQRADWTGALGSAAKMLADAPGDQAVVADALVLAFEQTAGPNAPALPERVKSELAAVTGALECVARAEYGAAQDLLRPLPRESMFADWKMLIKGMVAFHTGDMAKAEALLSRLPETGIPAQAAAAYRALASRNAPLVEAGMERVCRLFGVEGLASVVSRADRLWRSGSVAESYGEMRKFPDFPSEEPGLTGALSDFYFKCFANVRESLAARCFRAFYELQKKNRCKHDSEYRLICLALLREDLQLTDFDSTETATYLSNFLQHSPPGDRQTGRMAAILFEKLGSFNARMAPKHPFEFESERMDDSNLAQRFLLQSIEHDGDYLPAYLRLTEVYEFLKKTSERNRLMDEMTRRFPNEKAVLIKAGALCSQRKAYLKGIEYLERAHALDPLDQEALLCLTGAYIGVALQHYEKGALAKARMTYEAIFKIADREKFEPAMGLDFMLARQSVMERLFGEPGAAAEKEAAARKIAHSKPALLYFMHAYYRAKGPSGASSPFWDELQHTCPQSGLDRLRLVGTFLSLREVCEGLDLRDEARFIERCMEPLLKGRTAVSEIVELLALLGPGHHLLHDLGEKLLAAGLKAEPGHLRLRLVKFVRHADRISSPDVARSQLEALRDDAERAGDALTEKMVRELLSSLRLDEPFGDLSWMRDDDDGDEFDDDFLEGDEAGGIPSEMIETIEAIASMGPGELRMLRREMIGKGMPEALVDDLIESVRTGRPPKAQFPSMPPPRAEKPAAAPIPKEARLPKPVSKPRAPGFDDRQPELF